MCKHQFKTTFDHTSITGAKREQCQECGMLRWTQDGVVDQWMSGQYTDKKAERDEDELTDWLCTMANG